MSHRIPRIRSGVLTLLLGLPAMLCWPQEVALPPAAEAAAQQPATSAPKPATVSVVLRTGKGDIHVALEVERAPITAKNFLRYVDARRFDNITFYRALKITEDGKYGLLQGGLQNDPQRVYPKIAHESPLKTGLSHTEGAISMGRNEPGSAQADFFFVIGNLSAMDGKPDGSDPGYAVFGYVTAGLDVVRAMLDLPRSETARNPGMKGQMLAQPVKILTVRREP